MTKWTCSIAALAAALMASPGFSQCVLTQDKDKVTIENEYARLTFVPAIGGACASFWLKEPGWECTRGPTHGACEDRLWNVGEGYDLPGATYGLKVLTNSPDQVTLQLTAHPKTPGMTKLRVEKELTLRRGSRRIQADFRFVNEDAAPLPVAFWSANVLAFDKEPTLFFAPTKNGVDVAHWEYGKKAEVDKRNKTLVGEDRYLADPPRGWQAMVGAKSGVGLAWVMPDNLIGYVYDYLSTQVTTIEAIFNEISIAPGKELNIPTSFIVLKDMPRIDGAGTAAAGGLELPDKVDAGGEIVAKARILGARAGKFTVKAECKSYSIVNAAVLTQEKELSLNPDRAEEVAFQFAPKMVGTHVVRVTVSEHAQPVFDMERPVVIGTASDIYAFQPKTEKIGRTKAIKLPDAINAKEDPSLEWVEGIGLLKPLSTNYVPARVSCAQPCAGEPPRVLFCPEMWRGFEAVSAINRAEMRHDHVALLVPKRFYYLTGYSLSGTTDRDLLWEPCVRSLMEKL